MAMQFVQLNMMSCVLAESLLIKGLTNPHLGCFALICAEVEKD